MVPPKHTIFRERALESYIQRRERGVLLRLVSPPTLIFSWLLLLLLLGAGMLAWSIHVPVSVAGQGVLNSSGQQMEAVLFLPANQLTRLHSGQPTKLIIGSTGANLQGVVETVEPRVISPQEARTRFNLQGSLASLVTGPSSVITVRLKSEVFAEIYAGSVCVAQVQVGSQSVLSLIPGLNQIFK
ncbi:MAG: hypothetical protein J2P37_03695 [Ktedonobacteraceae bacterium]|nr:hypothetical protein [Ktedonobacteraceae bacterium]